LLFPTAGTPPAERSGQNLSGPKRAARIIIDARLNCSVAHLLHGCEIAIARLRYLSAWSTVAPALMARGRAGVRSG
jgi:hypothetical protein